MDKYQLACVLNRPCDCMAEIHESGIDEHDERVVFGRYMADEYMNTATVEYVSGDYDDLDMVCSKCGKSWINMNPIFND